jgi:hypothetical protein
VRKTAAVVTALVVAFVATPPPPADAHTERQLHKALRALKAVNARQTRQIKNLRARMLAQEFESNVCSSNVQPVSQFTLDFNFDATPDDTALDLDVPTAPQFWIQVINPGCVQGAAARERGGVEIPDGFQLRRVR